MGQSKGFPWRKLAQRQLRLMRSKLKIITMGWYKIATFDLIRSGLSGPPSPKGKAIFCLTGRFYRIPPGLSAPLNQFPEAGRLRRMVS